MTNMNRYRTVQCLNAYRMRRLGMPVDYFDVAKCNNWSQEQEAQIHKFHGWSQFFCIV